MFELYMKNSSDVAMIDDQHKEYVRYDTWYVDDEGYVRTNKMINGKRKNIKLHRVIANLIGLKVNGVSFKDGNKLNCQSDNLTTYVNKGRGTKDPTRLGIYDYEYKDKKGYTVNLWNKKLHKLKYHGFCETLEEAKKLRDKVMKENEI